VDAHEAVLWYTARVRAERGRGREEEVEVEVCGVVVDDYSLMWEIECLLGVLMLHQLPGALAAAVLIGDCLHARTHTV